MTYCFITDCVSSPSGALIDEMTGIAREMDLDHFIDVIAPELGMKDDLLERLGYQQWAHSCDESASDLIRRDLGGISVGRSRFMGIPCYFITHSRIEYIYIDEQHSQEMAELLDTHAQRDQVINTMADKLESHFDQSHESPGSSKKDPQAMIIEPINQFARDNESDLSEWSIPVEYLINEFFLCGREGTEQSAEAARQIDLGIIRKQFN